MKFQVLGNANLLRLRRTRKFYEKCDHEISIQNWVKLNGFHLKNPSLGSLRGFFLSMANIPCAAANFKVQYDLIIAEYS